jgi:hypothetical protein
MVRTALVLLLAVIGCKGGGNPAADSNLPGDGGGDDGPPTDGPESDGMDSCPSGQWCKETAPAAGVLLGAVWAASTGDVFAVGDGGTILRRTNNVWTAMQSNSTANLRGVWAANSSDVWAVGAAGATLHYDGSSWTSRPIPGVTADLHAVWGAAANDVWLIGSGVLVHWNGSAFAPTNRQGDFESIEGVASNDIYVTGENTKPQHWNGTAWSSINDANLGTTNFSVWAAAANDVWIGGFIPNKETIHWSGTAWSNVVAAGCIFSGFYGQSASDLWAAGTSKIGHWNGSSWMVDTTTAAGESIHGVGGSGSFVWVVGSNSLILHHN